MLLSEHNKVKTGATVTLRFAVQRSNLNGSRLEFLKLQRRKWPNQEMDIDATSPCLKLKWRILLTAPFSIHTKLLLPK